MSYTNDRLYTPEEAVEQAKRAALDEFSGPWWYDVRWSDRGTAAVTAWADTAEDLADIETVAWIDATETHLPYAERADIVEVDSFSEAVEYVTDGLDECDQSANFDVIAIAEELFVVTDVYDARGDLRDRRYVIPPELDGLNAFWDVAEYHRTDGMEE